MPTWLWVVSIIGSGGLGAAATRLIEGWESSRATMLAVLANTVTNLQKRVEQLEEQLREKSKDKYALTTENLALKLFTFRLKMEVNDARTILGDGPFYAPNALIEEPTLSRAMSSTEMHKAAEDMKNKDKNGTS